MKRAIGVTVGMLIVAAVALAIVPTTRDEIHWRWASHKDETANYKSYVETWPDGRHAAEAKVRYDEQAWADAQAANTVQGFERYVQIHGDGRYVPQANDNIESLHWKEATTTNTVRGFQHYIQFHDDGKRVREAKDRIELLEFQLALAEYSPSLLRTVTERYPNSKLVESALQRLTSLENTDWETARQDNTVDSYKDYLANYPNGRHATVAGARIQILEFHTAFGKAAMITEGQVRTYMKRREDETYSTVIRKPLEYYEIEGDPCRSTMTKRKVVVEPSADRKACSLQLEAGNLSVTAIYVSASSTWATSRALFPEKWKATMTHTGCAGPGLEIDLPSDRRREFKRFLDTFSVFYRVVYYTDGSTQGYVIPDLVWGSDRDGTVYRHQGHEFAITHEDAFKVDGVKGMPSATITTYKQALALKTYLNTIGNK